MLKRKDTVDVKTKGSYAVLLSRTQKDASYKTKRKELIEFFLV